MLSIPITKECILDDTLAKNSRLTTLLLETQTPTREHLIKEVVGFNTYKT